jgi:hypothetical protein
MENSSLSIEIFGGILGKVRLTHFIKTDALILNVEILYTNDCWILIVYIFPSVGDMQVW